MHGLEVRTRERQGPIAHIGWGEGLCGGAGRGGG